MKSIQISTRVTTVIEGKAFSMLSSEQIKHMVNRFLQWRLPNPWHPDGGISYTRPNYAPQVDATPVGTNLFSATQTDAMVRFMADGLPEDETGPTALEMRLHEALQAYARAEHTRIHHGNDRPGYSAQIWASDWARATRALAAYDEAYPCEVKTND